MDLPFKPEQTLMLELQDAFNKVGIREAIFLDHYDLEELTQIPASKWKLFLKDPLVADFILEELTMYRDKQIREILRTAKDSERSIGVAQMINALSKLDLDQMSTNNKVFIYSYVPLDREEQNADNVRELVDDVFRI